MVSRPLIDILFFWNLFNWTIIIYIVKNTIVFHAPIKPISFSRVPMSTFCQQAAGSSLSQQYPTSWYWTSFPIVCIFWCWYSEGSIFFMFMIAHPQWITLVSAGSVTFYDSWNIYLTFKSLTQLLANYCVFFDPVSLSGRVCSFFWPSLEQNYYTMKQQLWVEERQSWNLLSSASLLGYLKEAGFVSLCINPGQWEPLMPWLLPINPKRNSHVAHYPREWVHLHLLIAKTTWSRCSPREMQAGPWVILPPGALSLEY